MRVLVLGGAGYIGSHMVRHLQNQGDTPIVLDNFTTGHRAAVAGCPVVEADLLDTAAVVECLEEHRPELVMHFAARSIVPESVREPDSYYRTNLAGTMNLLGAMHHTGVRRLIFSSTAAVYGAPDGSPIPESAATQPLSPYGRTKLFMEQMIADYARAYGLRAISLRYFNAAGADASGEIGEAHEPETHLIPNILRSVADPEFELQLFGGEHPTPDGYCVRDYIHVTDLCAAHHLAGLHLEALPPGTLECLNLGNERGFSVLEVLRSAERVLQREIPHHQAPAREGDPPSLVADATRARSTLNWACEHSDLDNIVATAWAWHRNPRY